MLMPRLSTHPLKPLKSYHPPPPLIIRKTMLKEIEELFEAHMKIFNKKVEGNKPENGQNPMIFFIVFGPKLPHFLSSDIFWLKFWLS